MDDNDMQKILQRASDALNSADYARQRADNGEHSPADRAEHARAAHELAAYARELFAIVREGGRGTVTRPDAQPALDALTEDAWFRTTLAQVSTVHGCRVDFTSSADRSNVDFYDLANDGHVLCVADRGDIVEAFARALAQVPRMRPLLAVRPAR